MSGQPFDAEAAIRYYGQRAPTTDYIEREHPTPEPSPTRSRSYATQPPTISLQRRVHPARLQGAATLATQAGTQARTTADPAERLVISSRQFTDGFVPPDYLIDGLIQRRFLYSLTGATGAGKTAIAFLVAAHVALGKTLGDYEVEKGRVLYFAGENPTDLAMRWIALAEHLPFDPKAIDVHFLVGAEAKIEAIMDRIAAEVKALGGVELIIVDTSAAYFNCEDCKDENDNVQAGHHARMLRTLTTLPGGPAVVVLTHPTKYAKDLIPRGGGAFIAEVDGNFAVRKVDALVELHWQGKFRGPEFDPISFELHSVTAPPLRDTKGRIIHTVIAAPLSDEDVAAIEVEKAQDATSILALMARTPGLSTNDMAKALRWNDTKGKPHKKRVQTTMGKLKASKLVTLDLASKRYALTKKGEEGVKSLPPVPSTIARTEPDL